MSTLNALVVPVNNEMGFGCKLMMVTSVVIILSLKITSVFSLIFNPNPLVIWTLILIFAKKTS